MNNSLNLVVSRVKVERLLAEKDMSYSMLIENSNISKSCFYYMLKGEKSPSLTTVCRLCNALNTGNIYDVLENGGGYEKI